MPIAPSERYYEITKKSYVYSIMPIENISSVLENGILCFNKAAELQHASVAMPEVQARRDTIVIPGGQSLHEYANLYFSCRNPMMYRRKNEAEKLCVLAIRSDVLDIGGCIVSDRNAAASLAGFYSADDGIDRLDFDSIHARSWVSANPYVQRELKAKKCAEVLIPSCVPAQYIAGAYVVNDESRELLLQSGFLLDIIVNPYAFFR